MKPGVSKVILSGHILVRRHEIDAVKAALPEHIARTRAESGCLVFEVKEDQNALGRFSVYEEFSSPEAFAHHQKRASASEWGTITQNVTRHYTIHGLPPTENPQ